MSSIVIIVVIKRTVSYLFSIFPIFNFITSNFIILIIIKLCLFIYILRNGGRSNIIYHSFSIIISVLIVSITISIIVKSRMYLRFFLCFVCLFLLLSFFINYFKNFIILLLLLLFLIYLLLETYYLGIVLLISLFLFYFACF